MQVLDKDDAGSFGHFGQELRFYWSKLPNGFVFLGLLAAWCLLFQFCGWTSTVAGTTDSEVIDRFVVAGTGVVCITATRTVTTYANRSTGSLVSTTTYGEAQGLQTYTP